MSELNQPKNTSKLSCYISERIKIFLIEQAKEETERHGYKVSISDITQKILIKAMREKQQLPLVKD